MRMKNKKGQAYLLFAATLGFIGALLIFFIYSAPDIDDTIGGKQAAVISAVGRGEQTLSFVDTAARLSAWQSLFDIGESGGFYYDIGDDTPRIPVKSPCDKYVYNLWSSASEGECWPSSDNIKDAYTKYFGENLKEGFFSQHPNKTVKRVEYEYEVYLDENELKTVIRGLTGQRIPIPISYAREKAEKKIITSEEIPKEEEIVKCCDGNCIIGIAENYYDRYGPGGFVDLPYVWGGITPYPIEETIRNQNKKKTESFFDGAYVHTIQPSGNKRRSGHTTVPGFDCSGFVWWVYKHAELPQFYDKRSSGQLEQLAKDEIVLGKPGYKAICDNPVTCNDLKFNDDTDENKAMPGDLIFKYNDEHHAVSHVAIYIGNGKIIDSSGTMDGIDKRPLPSSWFGHITVYRFPYNTGCEAAQTEEETESGKDSEPASKMQETEEEADRDVTKYFTEEEIENIKKILNEDAYNRIIAYKDVIQKAAIKHDVSPELMMAIIYQESKGRPDVVSPSGCVGIAQFCYSTAKGYSEFGDKLTSCRCTNDNCKSDSTRECHAGNDNRFDPEKSIMAEAHLLKDKSYYFTKYSHKDAFTIGAYNGGQCVIKKAVDAAVQSTGKEDPPWSVVSQYITADMVYQCECCPGGTCKKYVSGSYFCSGDKADCTDTTPTGKSYPAYQGLCYNKVHEIRNYVDRVLKWYTAFGGASLSFVSSSEGVVLSYTKEELGYYYVNPNFTTEVDFDLEVFDGITAWARKTFEDCSGIQKDLGKCVEENMDEQNKAVDSAVESFMSNPSFGSVGMFSLMNLATSNLLFKFADTDECDGDDKGYYEFIETFEDCFDNGHPNCKCEFPKGSASKFPEINLSKEKIELHVNLKDDKRFEYYDFSDKKDFQLFHDKNEYDYVIIKKNGKKYELDFFKDGEKIKGYDYSTKDFYLVRDAKGFDDSVDNADELPSCELEGKKHKFRFCVISPAEPVLPKAYYDRKGQAKVKFENVTIRFALDMHDSFPGAIVDTESDDLYLSDEQDKKQQDAKNLPQEKKCEGLGKAKIDLEVTTPDLQPAYESFITSIVTTVVPQLKVLLFAKNILALKDFVPAMVSVKIDLNGASEDCNIAGIVYKCGVGVPPYKGVDKFDFSNPTGYIDVSSKFDTQTEYSSMPPNACMIFRNPDGSFMDESINYMKPDIDGDIISFSITKCTDPIAQYKKMSGLDIISSALHGFGYYFAFAYVDSDDEYGRPTVMTVQIPSVLDQLEEQLGITEWLVLKDVLLGNYDSVFKLLGVEDEYMFFRRSLSSASVDQLLRNLRDDALNSAFDEVGKSIKNDDAREIFDDLARDAADGRLDNDYAGELLEKAKEDLTPEEVDEFVENLDDDLLWEAYYYVEELSLQKKKEILAEVYEYRAEITGMTEDEVDEKLEEAMENKEKAVKIIREIDPDDKIAFAKQVMDDAPSMALGAAMNALDDNKKVAAIKDVLNKASNKKSELARIITHASPDYVKKHAIEYITDNVPGFSKYKDLIEIFSGDLEGVGC